MSKHRPLLTRSELEFVARTRFGDPKTAGPYPRTWHRIGYFTPDTHYEALVAKFVGPNTRWLDVGCGHELFPQNVKLAKILACRCRELVGLDPDQTIEENRLVHRKVRQNVEEFSDPDGFDLITLRMVAEHISETKKTLDSLARLTVTGGRVVIYTVNLWSPIAIAAWVTPFSWHHPIKKFVWGTAEKDTFPVAYRMNTRRELSRLFVQAGFCEEYFDYLADCRASGRLKLAHGFDLFMWKTFNAVGLTYPESCLLAAYQKA